MKNAADDQTDLFKVYWRIHALRSISRPAMILVLRSRGPRVIYRGAARHNLISSASLFIPREFLRIVVG